MSRLLLLFAVLLATSACNGVGQATQKVDLFNEDGKLIARVDQQCNWRTCRTSIPMDPKGKPIALPEALRRAGESVPVTFQPPKYSNGYAKALWDSQRAYLEQKKACVESGPVSPAIRDVIVYALGVLGTLAALAF